MKFKKILISLICFFLFPIISNADYEFDNKEDAASYVHDSSGCLESGDCVRFCQYSSAPQEHNYCYGALWEKECYKKWKVDTVTILYYPNEKLFEIVWVYNTLGFSTNKWAYNSLFDTKSKLEFREGEAYIHTNANSDFALSAECPKYSYIDESMGFLEIGEKTTPGDSICFDNNGEWCVEVASEGYGIHYDGAQDLKYSYKAEVEKILKESTNVEAFIEKKLNEYIKDADSLIKSESYSKLPNYCDSTNKNNLKDKYTFKEQSYFYKENASLLPLAHVKFTNYFNTMPDFEYFNNIRSERLTKNGMFAQLNETLKIKCQNINDGLLSKTLINEDDYNKNKENINTSFGSTSDKLSEQAEKLEAILDLNFSPASDCEGYIGEKTLAYLRKAFDIIKYISIILLLVFTIIDYFKGMISSDKDLINKATITAVKRAIICVIIFFLPMLIEVLLDLVGLTEGTCNIK